MTTQPLEAIRSGTYALIDVRTTDEYQQDHLENSVHIPHHEILDHSERIAQMPEPRFLYCRSGARSALAMQMLQQSGVTGLFNAGGIEDMRELLRDAAL
ncbi:MAG: rhodanese-like domain-containing protein [Cytophagia bacterium]|nr:rhodanese-like domain-containing protein [Cytophagia bacterium]